MSRIFISHSSVNNAQAVAIQNWLLANGWDDHFLDLDSERGIKAGERWQNALRLAAERCELVLFLISPAWASSKWCIAEFLLAKSLNKRVFGVIVEPTPLAELPIEMTSEWQIVDAAAGEHDYEVSVTLPGEQISTQVAFSQDALNRLRIGLMQAGIDARTFPWPPSDDPNRPPYRGLRPLESDDAGIYFGRGGSIVNATDILRGLRDSPGPRMLVILGASGAGKSSFMRAGILPRLARDTLHFVTLPIVRPESATITGELGLVHCLEKAMQDAGLRVARSKIREAVEDGPDKISSLLASIAAISAKRYQSVYVGSTKTPTLVLPIDQAEEMFLSGGLAEAAQFFQILRALLLSETPQLIALLTIRSDSYERLQTCKEFEGIRHQFLSLPPLPQGAFAEVIGGPARRLDGSARKLKIEEPLVDAILSDIEASGAKDALPLLAFTLERLYWEHGGDGDLKLSEYDSLGRIKGSIEAAVETALRAADRNSSLPTNRDERLRLLRRAFIPWLASIDPETKSPRRRIARQSEIPAESLALVKLLIDERLLSTDVATETGEPTVEPAHEALLRQWGDLDQWLAEDAAALSLIDGVKRAAKDWLRQKKSNNWLAHAGTRLAEAEGVSSRPDFRGFLGGDELDYLQAARKLENAKRQRDRLRNRIVQATAISATVAAVIAGLLYFEKERQREVLKETLDRTSALSNKMVGEWAEKLQDQSNIPQALVIDTLRKAEALVADLSEHGTADPNVERALGVALVELSSKLLSQNNVEEAKNEAQRAVAIFEALSRAAPQDVNRKSELIVALDRMGDVLAAMKDETQSADAYDRSLDLAREIVASRPNDPSFRQLLAVALEKKADLVADKDSSQALALYNESRSTRQQIANQNPTSASAKRELAVSLDRIGSIYLNNGMREAGLELMYESLRLVESAQRLEPTNSGLQREIAAAHQRLGDILKAGNDTKNALEEYQRDLDIMRTLVASDQTAINWGLDILKSYARVGDMLAATGQLDNAIPVYKEGLSKALSVAELTKGSPDWRSVSAFYQSLSKSLSDSGRDHEALAIAQEASRYFRAVANKNPSQSKRLSQALNNEAWYNLIIGRASDALVLSSQAIALDPGSFELRANKFHSLAIASSPNEAREFLTRSLKIEVPGESSLSELIRQDLVALRALGVDDELLGKIRQALGDKIQNEDRQK